MRMIQLEKFLRENRGKNIGVHYDKLCDRFGMERVVRCIKKRLSRGELEVPGMEVAGTTERNLAGVDTP